MISVIIPLYNAEETVISALESVRRQICVDENFEIIVIDDGSTDASKKMVEDYMAQHPEMNIVLLNQENKGVSAARNAGLKIASGEYIALLDADDEWLPEKTAHQLKYLREEGIDFLTTLRNGEKIWFPYIVNSRNLAKITLHKLLIRIDGQTSTAIFKKKILKNTGYFDEKQRYSEDANYWMRISEKNHMYILAENLVTTGRGKKSFGESGLSANLREMEKGIQKNIREMYLSGRIRLVEYGFYFLFSKLKYGIRMIK